MGRPHDPDDLHARVEHDLRNHSPIDGTGLILDDATEMFVDLGHWIVANVPPGREQSLALTNLEQTSMWSKAGIVRNQETEEENGT